MCVREVSLSDSLMGIKKVGHAGTLDPMATGLLVVCIGKATKVVDSYQVGGCGWVWGFGVSALLKKFMESVHEAHELLKPWRRFKKVGCANPLGPTASSWAASSVQWQGD